MKNFLTFLLVLITLNGFSQTKEKKAYNQKFDFRFGTGITILGTGDYKCLTFENELNYKFSRYFASSAAFYMGRNFTRSLNTNGSVSFFEGNLNLFVSPFRNNRLNDFRIGAGLSIYNVSDTYLFNSYYCEWATCQQYSVDKYTVLGGQFILEDVIHLSPRFFIGAKVYLQLYEDFHINNGAMIKFGVSF